MTGGAGGVIVWPMSEEMQFDVVIVGAGPAGLSAAIHLATKAQESGEALEIAVLEKGAEVGAHILSGAVLEPKALDQLIPGWRAEYESGALPSMTPAAEDQFAYLSAKKLHSLPTPPQMRNDGNLIISLAELCRWLAAKAEALGIAIFPGFAAANPIIEDERVVGVETGAFGIKADGSQKPGYQPPVALRASYTLIAEGARGSLAGKLIETFDLRQGRQPQTYGLGLKEVWEVAPDKHYPGRVFHSVGWPLDRETYGGSFIYHWGENKVSLGFVVGLDYRNPYLDPYETLQTFKTHPAIRPLLEDGRRISYGARVLNEGGWQSIPKLSFPGGALIGCSAGFVNVPKIKGIHTAMYSGMVAAETIVEALKKKRGEPPALLSRYGPTLRNSWVGKELYAVRNIRPAFRAGLWGGLAYSALETYILRGKVPWTIGHPRDRKQLRRIEESQPYTYAAHDGRLTFGRMDSVYLTNTNHGEDQPCHLVVRDPTLPIRHNKPCYDNPETRYCPAGVYEVVQAEGGTSELRINAQNCIHCKACDIKDPKDNIRWHVPEGGDGPRYGVM